MKIELHNDFLRKAGAVLGDTGWNTTGWNSPLVFGRNDSSLHEDEVATIDRCIFSLVFDAEYCLRNEAPFDGRHRVKLLEDYIQDLRGGETLTPEDQKCLDCAVEGLERLRMVVLDRQGPQGPHLSKDGNLPPHNEPDRPLPNLPFEPVHQISGWAELRTAKGPDGAMVFQCTPNVCFDDKTVIVAFDGSGITPERVSRKFAELGFIDIDDYIPQCVTYMPTTSQYTVTKGEEDLQRIAKGYAGLLFPELEMYTRIVFKGNSFGCHKVLVFIDELVKHANDTYKARAEKLGLAGEALTNWVKDNMGKFIRKMKGLVLQSGPLETSYKGNQGLYALAGALFRALGPARLRLDQRLRKFDDICVQYRHHPVVGICGHAEDPIVNGRLTHEVVRTAFPGMIDASKLRPDTIEYLGLSASRGAHIIGKLTDGAVHAPDLQFSWGILSLVRRQERNALLEEEMQIGNNSTSNRYPRPPENGCQEQKGALDGNPVVKVKPPDTPRVSIPRQSRGL